MGFKVSYIVSGVGMVECQCTVHVKDLGTEFAERSICEEYTGNLICAETNVLPDL